MAEIRKEPIDQYYEVGEELGRGRFAVVRKCKSKKTGDVFAGKFVRKARQGRSAREQLLLEIDILHTSRHPKMVRLYDVFETRTEMVLVIEYAPGGDLHRHCLEQVETVRTEKEICHLIRQIVEAVRYLHENNVVHLDLKPENILLKTDHRFPEIRLIDFGLSRRLDVPYSQFDIVGTPEYVAPEVLSYEPLDINADMWSIGVVTYVLLSGISPFAGDDVMETYANIGQVEYDFEAEEFDDISDEAKDFIDCLLIRQQKKRMSSRQALEHPWLKQLEDGIKPEDIEDAIKAESIIPTDVLTKAAELDPMHEETVSDAESEDYLSRESTSSPEEETSTETTNREDANMSCETNASFKAEPLAPEESQKVEQSEDQFIEENVAAKAEDTVCNDIKEPTTAKAEDTVCNDIKETTADLDDSNKDLQGIEHNELKGNEAEVNDHMAAQEANLPDSCDIQKNGHVDVEQNKLEGKELHTSLEVTNLVSEGKEEKSLKVTNDLEYKIDSNLGDHTIDINKVVIEDTSSPTEEKLKQDESSPSTSSQLYDKLLLGLSGTKSDIGTDENMNDSSTVPETPVERKKSTAIDIDAILGISCTPPAPSSKENESSERQESPVKKSFNIDDIIGKPEEPSIVEEKKEVVQEKEEVAPEKKEVVQEKKEVLQEKKDVAGINNKENEQHTSTNRSARKQSPDKEVHQKEKPSKVKATAAIFGSKSDEKLEHAGKSSTKVSGGGEKSNGSWKSPSNRSMRLSLDVAEPRTKVPLEKSRSAEYGHEEIAKLESKFGSMPSQISKVKTPEPVSTPTSNCAKNESVGEGKRFGSQKLHAPSPPPKVPSPVDDVKSVRQGIAAQMASKFSGKEAAGVKSSKSSTSMKDKDVAHASKVSQRIQELSTGGQRKETGSPSSSRSSSERSTPERTFHDRKTPERSSSERSSPERRVPDVRTPERSNSDKSSSGRSTPERKVLERNSLLRGTSGQRTPDRSPERRSRERSESPAGSDSSSKKTGTKARDASQALSVSERIKNVEGKITREESPPPATTNAKPGLVIGKGTPMKFVIGESFKVDFSPGGGMQMGGGMQIGTPTVGKDTSKGGDSGITVSSTNTSRKTSSEAKVAALGKSKDKVGAPTTNDVNSSVPPREKKPRSKTDTEALKKAAEIIRSTAEDQEGGRRRQPSMAELRGKNPSINKSDRGSPSSPRKTYRRLYVTHVKGSKTLEVVEGAISDVAEVKQKVDEDGLQVQLVMKLPTA